MTRFEQIEQRRRIDALNEALAALKPADLKLITAAGLGQRTLATVVGTVETVADDLHSRR